ncbi:hypothetical protein AAFC00_001237 [Neodothiora populina]|uniref:Uncharacterized protein n=1 Tax=Neodothiora populina TaxID=2781224 RepID=A0ABR3PP90_9PEZI
MTGFITNYIQSTATNLLATGISAAGTVAGNAVGGVGSLIENSGRNVGDGVANGIKSWGDYINSYGDKVTGATAASSGTAVAKKTAVKPATGPTAVKKSLPASTAPKAFPSTAQKALPPAGGKPKALPAPQSTNGKKSISAASKPKPMGVSNDTLKKTPAAPSVYAASTPASPTPSASSKTTSSGKKTISAASKPKPAGVSGLPKPPTGPSLNSVPRPPTGPTPPSDPFKSNKTSSGKVKISAASRPKPAIKV